MPRPGGFQQAAELFSNGLPSQTAIVSERRITPNFFGRGRGQAQSNQQEEKVSND
jgi:hypothetical protein